MSEGRKDDSAKARMDLLDWGAIEALAKVMGYGAIKYEANNWRRGIAWSRFIAAAFRHMAAFAGGEECDPESGHSHLAHAMANMMMLHWHSTCRRDLDDRYRHSITETTDTPSAVFMVQADGSLRPVYPNDIGHGSSGAVYPESHFVGRVTK